MKYTAHVINTGADSYYSGVDFCVRKPTDPIMLSALNREVDRALKKHNGYINIETSEPFQPRSAGRYSQNNHAHGHARQCGKQTGDYVEEFLRDSCLRAATKGYPTKMNNQGEIKPKPFKNANKAEASMVIEQLHEDAVFLGVKLIERDWEKEEYLGGEG